MKKCPFCETENEDNVNECIFCGGELSIEGAFVQTEEDNDGSLYSVLMPPNKYKGVIKDVKKFLKIGTGEAKNCCELGQIDGLSKAEAETLAVKLRSGFFPTRAVKTSLVAEYKKGLAKDKSWEVKLLYGEQNPAVIEFFTHYFDLDMPTAKDHLYFCMYDGDGTVYATDCKAEADDLALKLRALGAEVSVTEGEAIE
ncbi:MAG: hypothetical protein IJ308_07985 [Clostridia bacterium]|nr:hypothetical protein [Clostridia bacterium]